MEAKLKDYAHTLEMYNQMVVQSKLNRGGNPALMRLLKIKLEQLEREIEELKAQSSS